MGGATCSTPLFAGAPAFRGAERPRGARAVLSSPRRRGAEVGSPGPLNAVGAVLSGDGRVAELRFVHAAGRVVRLHFRPEEAGAVLSSVEAASAEVCKGQGELLGGADPWDAFPVTAKHVTEVQGGMTSDGVPSDGLRLDSSLDRARTAAWLKG